MIDQRNLGRKCPFAENCPVYKGKLTIERISTPLLKNVFYNRGYMGWKNCERFIIAKTGTEIPESATPYNSNVETFSKSDSN